MRARKLMALAATGMLVAGLSVPANAAETYKILGGLWPGSGVGTYNTFNNGVAQCDPTFAPTGTNEPGIDWKLVNVTKYAGKTVRIEWAAESAALAASLDSSIWKSTCIRVGGKLGVTSSNFTLAVPAGSKWLIVAPNFGVNVTFTITQV